MLLSKWKNYLYENNFVSFNKHSSIWDGLTDFFSFTNTLDTFNIQFLNNVFDNTNLIFANFTPKNYSSLDIDLTNIYFLNISSDLFNFNFSLDNLINEFTRVIFVKNDSLKLANFLPNSDVHNMLASLDLWFDDLDNNSYTQYELSVPNVKLYYPEPFIASPSFTHEEIWFIHILHYNYWLWFFFISLIMFYFITFIHVVRWCNLRVKPKRETRGVSRSKCADLITACVPVSWAISIIVSETVDAADYYDGFGTGEIVIGIRAYQWGWEYFYPKNIDLNYNVKPSYSVLLGNSIKYNNSNSNNLKSNNLWKYYQKKNSTNQVNTPANLILSPNDSNSHLNNINFSNVGSNISKDSEAFKKIQKFSKLSSSNVSLDTINYNNSFKNLDNLYLNQSTLNNNSYFYNSFRQHNFSSSSSFLSSFSSLVDQKSFSNFFSYVLNVEKGDETLFSKVNPYNAIYNQNVETKKSIKNIDNYKYVLEQQQLGTSYTNLFFNKWINYFDLNYNKNNTSDGKNDLNPFISVSKTTNPKTHLIKSTNDGILNELLFTTNKNYYSWNLFNESKSYKFKDLKSANLQFLSPEKNIRTIVNKKLNSSDQSLTNKSNIGWIQSLNLNFNSDLTNNYFNSINNWNNNQVLKKTTSLDMNNSLNQNPIFSNNPSWKTLSYSRKAPGLITETPTILRGKEESAPEYIFSSYWSSYYKNINLQHNFDFLYLNNCKLNKFYLPKIEEYSEYDFRNWQALHTLEDALWESSYSTFSHDEYMDVKKNINEAVNLNKVQLNYNLTNRILDPKLKINFLNKSFFLVNTNHNFYSLPITINNSFLKLNNLNLINLNYYNNDANYEMLEENYENIKNFKFLYSLSYQNLSLGSINHFSPSSYTTVLDYFRADYDENNWNVEYEDTLENLSQINNDKNLKLTNNIKLRSTAKNSIVTYNAIQKVFKSRFDESRSNVNFSNFTNSYIGFPFITDSKSSYENMIGKNKESFFNVNLYNSDRNSNLSIFIDINNSLNTFFIDIPFLLSMKSDASRYLWFDWQSRWSSIEVQPSSIAKYSLAGLPYFNKVFEYSTQLGDELNESENYLTKLSKARKNYMPNWGQSPYFFLKISNWFNTPFLYFDSLNITLTKNFLSNSHNYWKSLDLNENFVLNYSPTSSNLNRSNVTTWSPINELSSYYYSTSILNDILSKREYIYRNFFKSKSNFILLPDSLTVSTKNNLLNEIKSTYLFIDPATYSSEITREFLYQNNNFLKFTFIKNFLGITSKLNNSSINLNFLDNYFIYLLGNSNSNDLSKNTNFYKSQYRPMKKGITNMIRLQATNAIAMPTEIRLHILASSKDVIHSWAIPSAGIKIDCVPGYSSHKVAIFLTHGIFWGQCMEICGRYHHWMPIVVYFMKRDLFFLWCTHFMHYSDLDNSFNMTDKHLSDFLKLVSFDNTTWVNEINRNFN